MIIGTKGRSLRKPIPLLASYWEKNNHRYTEVQRMSGDANCLLYAAKKYKTNFLNSIIANFKNHQKKYVRLYCNSCDIENWYGVFCDINNWTHRDPIDLDNEQLVEFIRLNKISLGLEDDDRLSDYWLENNVHKAIRYMYGLLYRFEECGEKLYHLAPVCGLRNHFITIDTKILYYLLKSSNLVSVAEKEFYKDNVKYEHWSKIFKVPKPANFREFDYMVDTDGVSACFLSSSFKSFNPMINLNSRINLYPKIVESLLLIRVETILSTVLKDCPMVQIRFIN
jgi:hypothetical protein